MSSVSKTDISGSSLVVAWGLRFQAFSAGAPVQFLVVELRSPHKPHDVAKNKQKVIEFLMGETFLLAY